MADDTLSPTRFVNHRVPQTMVGSTLYPLNHLEQVLPNVAAAHRTKYYGREALRLRRIPRLNCLWNDVLMFSPVHPQVLKTAVAAAGHTHRPHAWFVVDVRNFTATDTVIFVPRARAVGDFTIDADQILPFRPQLLDTYIGLPAHTQQYYASIPPGQPLALFFGLTHVLYNGSLPVADLRVIEA